MKVRYYKYYDIDKAEPIIDSAKHSVIYVNGGIKNHVVNIAGLVHVPAGVDVCVYEGRENADDIRDIIKENTPKGIHVKLFEFKDYNKQAFVLVDKSIIVKYVPHTPEELKEYRAECVDPDEPVIPVAEVSSEKEDIEAALKEIQILDSISETLS